jgi:hypothetical protein
MGLKNKHDGNLEATAVSNSPSVMSKSNKEYRRVCTHAHTNTHTCTHMHRRLSKGNMILKTDSLIYLFDQNILSTCMSKTS